MKSELNKQIRDIVENGYYIPRSYNQELYIRDNGYHYRSTTADNMFHFQHQGGEISLPLQDVEWQIFWDKLRDIPVDDDGDTEENFEHFEAGESVESIWHWFEWFFDISIGEEFFS